jgi:hypothetical protein
MTPEQIRGRCREVLRDFTDAEHAKRELDVLESLYREAMAAGLEMAADDAKQRQIHAERSNY